MGLSVTQAMERVIEGMKGPLSSEFTLVLNKIKLGMSVEEAMTEMAERVPMPGYDYDGDFSEYSERDRGKFGGNVCSYCGDHTLQTKSGK